MAGAVTAGSTDIVIAGRSRSVDSTGGDTACPTCADVVGSFVDSTGAKSANTVGSSVEFTGGVTVSVLTPPHDGSTSH